MVRSGANENQLELPLERDVAAGTENPIEQLRGKTTDDGWTVLRKISKSDVQTGGCFSVGYIVRNNDGREGYLKALDFQSAQDAQDPPRALQKMLATFNFERDLLELCRENRMSRVVRALTNGAFVVPGAPLDQVYYLIFELADGDARTQTSRSSMRDYGWAAKMCHQIAVGLRQLHKLGITHQDLKPSNVLVFEDGQESKLADLGRAHCHGVDSPHDDYRLPGAVTYAPPEQLYGYEDNDRLKARRSADLYLLGSMIMFGFSGVPMTPALVSELRAEHRPFMQGHPNGWRGMFHDVLPYLMDAWANRIEMLEQQLSAVLPAHTSKFGKELTDIVRYLTNPDPDLRGHPQARIRGVGHELDLERVVSKMAHISAALKHLKSNR